ncbi:hypothetical protein Q8A73_011109 [Channa argus]|nr:hypothetical protein Q8A73_011109 [Channa argus]
MNGSSKVTGFLSRFSKGNKIVSVKSVQMGGSQLFKSCCPRRDSSRASFPTVSAPWSDVKRVILSTVFGLRCVQSHRDERACRVRSGICAFGEELRHGNGRGCAQPLRLKRENWSRGKRRS